MFLVESTNNQDISSFLDAETARVTELLSDGTLQHCWLKADFSGAVMVLSCSDVAQATDVLNTFPTARHGATDFQLTAMTTLDSAS